MGVKYIKFKIKIKNFLKNISILFYLVENIFKNKFYLKSDQKW